MPESKEDGPSLFPGAQAMKNLKTQALPPMFTEKTFFFKFREDVRRRIRTDHADYLGNAEISKVAKELQSESYSAMASKSKFDDMAAALISQLEAGTPNVKPYLNILPSKATV
ncbi:MAG: hypothetical protein ACLUI0_15725 [Blautia massiliensis (ex Durand et al. 2017)]